MSDAGYVETYQYFPVDCIDFHPNYNYTPILFVSRQNPFQTAVIKLHLDKQTTKSVISQRTFNTSYWQTNGFMTLPDVGQTFFTQDSVNPSGLVWNVAMLEENAILYDIVHNPKFVMTQFAHFPTLNTISVDTPNHGSIKSLTLEFPGGPLHLNQTRLKIVTRNNLHTQVQKEKHFKETKHTHSAFYLEVRFNSTYM